jgi:hypothetical protein
VGVPVVGFPVVGALINLISLVVMRCSNMLKPVASHPSELKERSTKTPKANGEEALRCRGELKTEAFHGRQLNNVE